MHRITAYSKAALWDGVQAWFDGGQAVSGAIDPKAASVHTFDGQGRSHLADLSSQYSPRDKKVPLAWSSFATPVALDDTTYGYRWNKDLVTKTDSKDGSLVTLPEYYRLEKDPRTRNSGWWSAPRTCPAETGLAKVAFPRRGRPLGALCHSR